MALAGRRALRAYFSGQDIALGLIAVPLLAVISFGLAAVAGHPVDGFLGLAVDLAGIGAGLALSNIFTVTVPYPMEKRAGSPTPQGGQRLHRLRDRQQPRQPLGTAVAVVPVMLAAMLTGSDPAGGPDAGARARAPPGTAWRWPGPACDIAARAAEQKLPELYQIAVRSKL